MTKQWSEKLYKNDKYFVDKAASHTVLYIHIDVSEEKLSCCSICQITQAYGRSFFTEEVGKGETR
jgi:hypothetical protein